jgi:hypothetical protein
MATNNGEPVRMRLAGSSNPSSTQGLEPTGGISNHFIGNDPEQWQTEIPNFKRVEFKGVYPGVDLVYYGNPQSLEYDFVLAPGGDPRAIQVEYSGVETMRVEDGELVMVTKSGEFRQRKPVAYQGPDKVDVSYRVKDHRVSFDVLKYDPKEELVIDPMLVYSSYLGGGNDDRAQGVAVDANRNVYVTGFTRSTNFPSVNAIQATYGGLFTSAFVTKISPDGSTKLYSTYLGGETYAKGRGIAVDGNGNAYLTGEAAQSTFPIVNAFQPVSGGGYEAYVAKLNSTSSALLYSSFLGGSGEDYGYGIGVDGNGSAYVVGYTASTDFPTIRFRPTTEVVPMFLWPRSRRTEVRSHTQHTWVEPTTNIVPRSPSIVLETPMLPAIQIRSISPLPPHFRYFWPDWSTPS